MNSVFVTERRGFDMAIGLPVVAIPAATRATLLGNLAECTAATTPDELLASLIRRAGVLPAELVERLLRLRADPQAAGALLIRGLPVDVDLPPTPTTSGTPVIDDTAVSRLAILMIGILMGEPVAYAAEKNGELVQNVFPTREHRESPSNDSSAVALEFHTELTFSRSVPAQSFDVAAPDFVLLFALRSPPDRSATTTTIEARDICRLLSAQQIDVLRQPWFELRAPYSFTQDSQSCRPWSPPHALVSGSRDCPELTFDISCGVRARRAEAEHALDALRRVCAEPAIQRPVVLNGGDLLVIDNHKCAHARSHYTARFDGKDRWLQRLYVRHSIRALQSVDSQSYRVIA
jgi:L-asparagine oxygenase